MKPVKRSDKVSQLSDSYRCIEAISSLLCFLGSRNPPMLRSAERVRGENSSRRLRGRSNTGINWNSVGIREFLRSLWRLPESSEHTRPMVITSQFYSRRPTRWWQFCARPSRRFSLIDYAYARTRNATECEGNSLERTLINSSRYPMKDVRRKFFDKVKSGGEERGGVGYLLVIDLMSRQATRSDNIRESLISSYSMEHDNRIHHTQIVIHLGAL